MFPSDAVKTLAALNSTQYFVRTVASEYAELMVIVTLIYRGSCCVSLKYIWCLFVVTWLEGKNKFIGLLMIKHIS